MKIRTLFNSLSIFIAFQINVNVAVALNWNDPGVIPVYSGHRWRDANTGRFVKTTGMSDVNQGENVSGKTDNIKTEPNTNKKSDVKPKEKTDTTKQEVSDNKKTDTAKNGKNILKKGAAGITSVAIGGSMVYSSVAGKDKHGVVDVFSGITGGAIAGAPFGGWIGTAVGAAAGGLIAGSQIFSETDCLTDPVTGLFTCCNTVFNKGERQAAIGDYMFCGKEEGGQLIGMPGLVRQCLQGGSATADTWFNGLWKDDYWTPECVQRLCATYVEPVKGIEEYTLWLPDTNNICWDWTCVDGFTRHDNTCVSDITNVAVNRGGDMSSYDPYGVAIQQIENQIAQIQATCNMSAD